jgi:hypothetical protein
MRWRLRTGSLVTAGAMSLTGCATTPPLDNPVVIKPGANSAENPLIVAGGTATPDGYADIYDRCLDALDDYFLIKPSSRYSGIIETLPRVAPGWEQPWKPSTPDARERLLATMQSMRQYAVVKIWANEGGGYKVYVEVYKELEDNPRPSTAMAGTAFRDAATVDRRSEVVTGLRSGDSNWIPAGKAPHRDYAFEQVILKKILYANGVK